ncbi:MAG: FliG C-terminal domain-containing protein [Planctomycetota bacterium]
MALSGTRKAAMLLKGLDSGTAGTLLRAVPSETITRIAAELAYLDAYGGEFEGGVESVMEFFTLLDGSRYESETKDRKKTSFVEEVLRKALDGEKLQEALGRVERLVESREPFQKINSASVEDIAKAVEGESAEVVSLVLSELSSRKSSQLLGLLDEKVRDEALHGMTEAQEISPETSLRIANVFRERLDKFTAKTTVQEEVAAEEEEEEVEVAAPAEIPDEEFRNQKLRKVAVLLRVLDLEPRDEMLAKLKEKNAETAESVKNLMVIWEDIPVVAERSLQEILRQTRPKMLALALAGADAKIVSKIRENISERAAASLDEEASFLSDPKPEEIEEAREAIVALMREANIKGELTFEDSSDGEE